MIYAVRSDESTHRFVNHSLASLRPEDVNPFAISEPSMGVKGERAGCVFCFDLIISLFFRFRFWFWVFVMSERGRLRKGRY